MKRTYRIAGILLFALHIFAGTANAQTILADEIPVSYDVSGMGAFTYNVPLRIPPGIKDLMPQLSISYNSQAPNGMLGMGWSIGGLSMITRGLPTIYHNNTIAPVDFGANSSTYFLDGQRMFYDPTTAMYNTEIKNFAHITESGTSGTGPTFFTVEYPNGLTYEYGDPSSPMTAVGRSENLMWPLYKVHDRCGNYVQFEYFSDVVNGNYRISRILYTGNSTVSLTPPGEIDFSYTARQDKEKTWVYGSQIVKNDILDKITVKLYGTEVNRYEFTYANVLYTHLKKIKEILPGNEELPPITFNWGKEDLAHTIDPFTKATTTVVGSANYNFTTGDFNGDGATDFIRTPLFGAPSAIYEPFFSDKNDDFTAKPTGLIPFSAGLVQAWVNNQPNPGGKMSFDYNGDGLDDEIFINYNNVGSSFPSCNIWVSTAHRHPTNIFNPPVLVYASMGNSVNYFHHFKVIPGDYDGDGKKELLILEPDDAANWHSGDFPNRFWCRLVGDEYNSSLTGDYVGDIQEPNYAVFAADFNGDGKDDLFRTMDPTNTGGIRSEIWTINFDYDPTTKKPSVHTPVPMSIVFNSSSLPDYNQNIWNVDFNGDGKRDLLTWDVNNNWRVAYSTGYAYNWQMLPSNVLAVVGGYTPALNAKYGYEIADFNGDGKDDILQLTYPNFVASNDIKFNLFYSKGNNEFEEETRTIPNFTLDTRELLLGDYNGDGQTDLLYHDDSNPLTIPMQIVYFRKNDISRLITSVEQDGKRIEIEHSTLAQDPDYVQVWDHDAFFSMQSPKFRVVKELSDGQEIHKKYTYGGFFIHRLGLGLRGFDRMQITNLINETYLDISTDVISYSIPVPIENWVHYYNTTKEPLWNSFDRATYKYAEVPGSTSGQSRIVYKTEEIYTSTVECLNTKKEYNYSTSSLQNLGKPISEVEKLGYNISTGTYELLKRTVYNYPFGGAFYNWAKPAVITSTSERTGKPISFDAKKAYTYNAKGLITNFNDRAANYTQTQHAYTYDDFGNVITEITTGSNLPQTFTNTYRYSNDGRFMQRSQNTLGYTDSNTYNGWGMVLSNINANGLTTTNEYDKLNRLTKTTGPTGVFSTITYDYATSSPDKPTYQTARFSVKKQTNGISGTSVSFTDMYGRNLRDVTTAFDGQLVYSDRKYNALGQLEWQSAPYYKNTGIGLDVTTYTYDKRGSVCTTANPLRGTVKVIYTPNNLGQQITYTNLTTGKTKIVTLDATGATKKINDNGTTIDYDYASCGKPEVVTVSNGATSSSSYFSYDNYGRMFSKTEPNAGTHTYNYDAIDNIRDETDNNGNTYVYTYDNLGRIATKTGPDGPYTYTYDNTLNVGTTGKLINEKSPYLTQTTYNYDAFGRPAGQTKVANGQAFTSSTTYDIYGRMQTQTYPSGDVVQNNYNTYGFLESIDLINSPKGIPPQRLWKVNSKDHLGHTTQSDYYASGGAMFTCNEAFDAIGLPSTASVTYNPTLTNVMDYEYSFDPVKKNLTYRKDLKYGLTENFTYDLYDRLTNINSTSPAVAAVQMSYSDGGNILKKTDVTTSTYAWKYNEYGLTMVPEPQTSTPAYTIPIATQTATYFPFNKVKVVAEANKEVHFTYGPEEQRAMAQYYDMSASSPLQKTRYYAEAYEKTTDATTGADEEISYVWGDGRPVAMLYHKTGSVSQIYYPVTDYLGSITHILDQGISPNGLKEERSFDAWGRLRDPATWICYTTAPALLTDRGYTGHEHLWDFNIVNMNGRLYDPLVGRMFSPDPHVTDAENSQAYNKYSYALNNPLFYTDPTGNDYGASIGAGFLIGAAIGGASYTLHVAFSGGHFKNWDNAQLFKSMAIGGISGALSGGIGAYFGEAGAATVFGTTGQWSAEAARAGLHGLVGAGTSYLSGGNPWIGFATGSLGSLAGSAYIKVAESGSEALHAAATSTVGMTVFSGLVSGVTSTVSGGNFLDGFTEGAIVSLVNHSWHKTKRNSIKSSDKQRVYTLDEFLDANYGKNYFDIITQKPAGNGLPGGPALRYVLNPVDGNVMDMRHVMVVGYMGGNMVGYGVEIAQWIGGLFGANTAGSAFDPQDFYSNSIGSDFRDYMGQINLYNIDWSAAFYYWLLKQ